LYIWTIIADIMFGVDCERLLFYCINIMLLRNFYFEIKIGFIWLDDTTGKGINSLELS